MNLSNSAFVSQSVLLSQDFLTTLAHSPQGKDRLKSVFGDCALFDAEGAIAWLTAETQNDFSNFPTIKIVLAKDINYARGAYSADTDTIYLATEFVTNNSGDLNRISNVILEEYGHFLDAQFNPIDTPGDEGYLFSGLIQQRSFTEAEIADIRAESDIATVILNDTPILIEQANSGDNPAFDLIGLTQLRNDPQFSGINGSGLSVAIIDSGIDTDHPLLAPNYVAGYDFFDGDGDPSDPDGHGTHVAGTIGATDETIGVAPEVGLIGLRVLDSNGGSLFEVEDALEWIFDNREQYNITAVNLSSGLGFFTPEESLQGDIISDDIQRLEDAGVTVIGAAGNEYFANSGQPNQENLAFPAISSTLAVGAVWQDGTESDVSWQNGSIDYTTGADRIVSFSQRLNTPNLVFAPGGLITSTILGGGIDILGGTSHASPHVAGAVALIQQTSQEFNGRLLTPEEVREILLTTGDPIVDGDDEDDNIVNTGNSYVRINIYNAVSQVKAQSDFAPPPENDLNGSITQVNALTSLPIVQNVGVIGRDEEREVGDRDVDFYRINSKKAGVLKIWATSNNEDSVNTVATIFGSQGRRLRVNNPVNSSDSLLRYQIAPNTDYYVAITGFGNQNFDPFVLGSGTGGDMGTYTFNGNLIPLEEAELIDNTIGSSAVQNISSGETLPGNVGNDSGSIVGDTDVDLYRFVPTADGMVNIKTIVDREFSTDTYLRIFDSAGNEIAANDNQSDLDRSSFIQLDVTAKTEYYIGINGSSLQAQQYNPLIEGAAPGSQGNYDISISSGNDIVTGSTVYRFFRPDVGVHFYTASEIERDSIIANLPNYSYEGKSYISAAETADPITGARPVYRFFNNSTGAHLYTMSEVERDSIDSNLPNYAYEGIAYYGYQSDRLGATPLYRFYNPVIDAHFYTPSTAEREAILANLPDYQLESDGGIAFYVEPVDEL